MNKSKSGAQKRRDKLARELQTAASEPKQRKLCFVLISVESAQSDSPDTSHSAESRSPDETEENETLVITNCEKSKTIWPSSIEEKLKLLTMPSDQPVDGIPFQRDIYFQSVKEDQRIQRKWLTYDSVENKLYCKICGCFSTNRLGELVCGFGGDNFRRASQTVKRHENSQCHRDASDMYFRDLNRNDIASLIPQWLQTAKSSSRDKVKKNREVLHRIIEEVL